MTYLSEHLYWQDKPDVPAHVAQARDGIRKVAEAHRAYRREIPALEGREIRIALDEWNYWYGPNEYASSAHATSCRTAWGSRRACTSSSATATST
jgi:alpha-N-arabinofuranosidase